VKALIPIAFAAAGVVLAQAGSPVLAGTALACGFLLALVALTRA
jgi:hypothetical protein